MYPAAYIAYLVHFHGDRDYFECHEVLEEYWKEQPAGRREQHWVGLIQIAVALYHQRRGNLTGAMRMLKSAIAIIEQEQPAIAALGLDVTALLALLHTRLKELQTEISYTSIQLPITDAELEKQCIAACRNLGFTWRSASNLDDDSILHRHTRRDRSSVIAERQRALQQKKQR